MSLVVGDDLLDAHRRWEFVDSKMTGIDDLDTFSRQEPDFPIGALRDARTVFAGRKRTEPDTVRRIPNRRFNPTLRVGNPRVQFSARDAHEAALRVQPEGTIVVLYRPVNRVARQAIPACKRSDATIFKPASASLGCGPQRPIPIELKIGDMPFAQTISGCV